MKTTLWILDAVVLLLVAIGVVTVAGLWRFDRQMKRESDSLLLESHPAETAVITEADLQRLPEPVQRYMRYTGVIGHAPIRNAVVQQSGGFRISPEQPWLPFRATEAYSAVPAGFVWRARISTASLPILTVRDYYRNGEGGIIAKLGGLAAVADAHANEASLMRYFNELMWLPTAYLSDNVQWEAVDESHARATITDHGMSATALFTFDEEGRLTNFEADRYCSDTDQIERWGTPLDQYAEFNGLNLPSHGRGVWLLDSGDYSYIDLQIEAIRYDVER